jgi:hypothetical protein
LSGINLSTHTVRAVRQQQDAQKSRTAEFWHTKYMVITLRWRHAAKLIRLGLGILLATASMVGAQQEYIRQEFSRGQNVQPAFEGWERNTDGTFNLVFGYLNRNYEEAPEIPIGPNNQFEGGQADRGQPTYFHPRRQHYVFKVQVPSDFGNNELIWSVTHNGRTDKAVGHLAGFYEIDAATYRPQRSGHSERASTTEEMRNRAPAIALEGPAAVTTTVGASLKLTVTVRDEDGLPGPARESEIAEGAGASDSRKYRVGAAHHDRVNIFVAQKTGLAVTWLQYRGAGTVTFDPVATPLPLKGGKATTAVVFGAPGTYVVRAVADDQIFTTPVNVTVSVKAATK